MRCGLEVSTRYFGFEILRYWLAWLAVGGLGRVVGYVEYWAKGGTKFPTS